MTGTINIGGANEILQGLRSSIKDGVSPEKLKGDFLKMIGIGDKFTSKALRVLSGRLPFSESSSLGDTTRERIRDIIEIKKRNADSRIIWNFVLETGFIRDELNSLFRSLSLESLVGLHTYIFNLIHDEANIDKAYDKYRLLIQCLENQIEHKKDPSRYTLTTSGKTKTFYGPGIRANNTDTTNMTRIQAYSLKRVA